MEHSPLAHEPNLMLAVLRVAAVGSGTLDDCLEHLRQLRRYAQVEEPVPESEVRNRLETVQAKLRLAGLIHVGPCGRCQITAFGRRVLADNPGGVDESELMQLAKPRHAQAHRASQPPPPDRGPFFHYQQGYEAFHTGAALADNPYPRDARAHLDWENGWSQARDDEFA